MKMIIRADDVGFTKVHNMGTFKAVDEGLVTSCDVMLDTPGTIEALQFLRERPWISVGWHAHFWGSPVLDPSQVPTMYDASRGHFRKDLARAEDVSYEECLAEMRAQMELCIKYLGRTPDVGDAGFFDSTFQRAMNQVMKEYGVVTKFAYMWDFHQFFVEKKLSYTNEPEEQWKERKIYFTVEQPGTVTSEVFRTDSIKEQRAYDPLRRWFADEVGLSKLPEDATAIVVLHPGYIDYYVACEGSQTPAAWNYLATRVVEAHSLCSRELKDWVLEHKVELVNFRDALYGTKDYQNHLRHIDSALFMK